MGKFKAWRYLLFMFALVCCGFVFNSSKVEAAPTISLPSNNDFNYNEGVVFYVGHDFSTTHTVRYRFDNGEWIDIEDPANNSIIYNNSNDNAADKLCDSVSYIETCTDVIFKFIVDAPSSDYFSANTTSEGTNDGGFVISVYADNGRFMVFGSGESEATSDRLYYDDIGPTIDKISITRTNFTDKLLKIGSLSRLVVTLSETSFISEASLSFRIGDGGLKTVYYIPSSYVAKNKATSTFTFYYYVKSGDYGDFHSFVLNIEQNKVKDLYNNSMTAGVYSFSNVETNGFSADGVKPRVLKVDVDSGIFSTNKDIGVVVSFSEELKASSASDVPYLNIKFGDGAKKTCTFSSGTGANLYYICRVGAEDAGAFTFVSLSGGSGLTDLAGNKADLSFSSRSFSQTIANNNLPAISEINVAYVNCVNNNSVQYCKFNSSITISITFNMDVEFVSSDMEILFDGVEGAGSLSSSYEGASNSLVIIYRVNEEDNGKLSLNFSFELRGDNGIVNNISNTRSFDCYVDNSSPVIEDMKVYFDDEEVEGNVIYSGVNDEVVAKIFVKDSYLMLDANEVYLLDSFGNELSVGEMCDIKSFEVLLEGNVLVVKIVSNDNHFENDFKIKVSRGALSDVFGRQLETDYVSDLYTLDTLVPEFEAEVIFPEYKGYYDGSKYTLISGDRIDFKINSDDEDLLDYCVVGDVNDECDSYEEIVKDGLYEYNFSSSGDGVYSFYVVVRDHGLNKSYKKVSFEYGDIFEYSNGFEASVEHVIKANLSIFENGTKFNYRWFEKDSLVDFEGAYVSEKQNDSQVFEFGGDSDFNGEYRVCVRRVTDGATLCSEYVVFDTKIDRFEVEVDSEWANDVLNTRLIFDDISVIKCIAIGMNVSSPTCDGGERVTVYRTSQAVNPFTKYKIEENGVYYFYIEDMVGNSEIISKTINNIDSDSIVIDVFNGNFEGYNPNLGVNVYKNNHKFLVTFDKDVVSSSEHSLYRYFFSTNTYDIDVRDSFDNNYYANVEYRGEVVNSVEHSLMISAPVVSGTYNLYIMAIDVAGNVSFADVEGINVDMNAPIVHFYDSDNSETNGGSVEYIATFDYTVTIEDKESGVDLNRIYYEFVDDNGDKALSVQYKGCAYNGLCSIEGNDINLKEGHFNPLNNYYFVVIAYDNAGNKYELRSNSYKIDTTAPEISVSVDENVWYKAGVFNIAVNKNSNVGTLNNVAYCVNDCFVDDEYDLNKFTFIDVNNPTAISRNIKLEFDDGENQLYVYASDIFGNYSYVVKTVKYDVSAPTIIFNNALNGVIDLSDSEEKIIDFTVSDTASGVKSYCVYLDEGEKDCVNVSDDLNIKYNITLNGEYYVEVMDVANNVKVYSVIVVGIDTEPISFDLASSLGDGKFTNDTVTISIINMRKPMFDNVNEKVSKIDYVRLDCGATIGSYEEAFNGEVISVYSSGELVTSFVVNENGLYIVRVIDTANHYSYNYIEVIGIDKVEPFVNTNKIGDEDRIRVTTSSGNNIRVYVEDNEKIYRYSNETLQVLFSVDSLRDLSTGFNNYLGLKICFDDSECVYNTYSVANSLSGDYLVNSNEFRINAPYNFSGVIRYYAVDGAGNESDRYEFLVEYKTDISDVTISLKDSNGNDIDSDKKYNEITVNFDGSEVNEIINTGVLKYAFKEISVNLNNEFANMGVNEFLAAYNFVDVSASSISVSKEDVDDSYYLWVFVKDLVGNYKLIKVDTIVRIDTIAPAFSDIELIISKHDSDSSNSKYYLVAKKGIGDYKLYVNGSSSPAVFDSENKTEIDVSGMSSVSLELRDEAGNSVSSSFNLAEANGVYMMAYRENKTRTLRVVIYNLNGKSVTDFKYIVTGIDDYNVYDDNSINSVSKCTGNEGTCYDYNYTLNNGVYEVSFASDKRVIFYVYVDNSLIYDYNNDLIDMKVMVDEKAPIITFSNSNPSNISTKNSNSTFEFSVSDDTLSSLSNRYILTMDSEINDFNNIYNLCSGDCVKGFYTLDSEYSGVIEINSNVSNFYNLSSGKYYLYVYVEDDFGNVSLGKSVVNIDNDSPVIEYSLKGSEEYNLINSSVLVGEAIKLRFRDSNLNYFEIYENEVLSSTCYVDGSGDNNCVKDGVGEVGYKVENGYVVYYLDTGNYEVIAYDKLGNNKQIVISVDYGMPVIELYKKVGDVYEIQSSSKVYNSLNDLYIKVIDNNFNYFVIDLYNTISNEKVSTAVRYSYNSDAGECLVGNGCEYGKSLSEMLEGNTEFYNKIVIKAYDKANRVSNMEIIYDDVVPVIWMVDVGDKVVIDGVWYEVKEGMVIDVEIGVNRDLTLDRLLNKVILEVDGLDYVGVSSKDAFKVNVYKDSNVFNGNLLEEIGSYELVICYIDDAGNEAISKELTINVTDNVSPVIEVSNVEIELNELVELKGFASDNYGLEKDGSNIIKEKYINSTSCSALIDGSVVSCDGIVVGEGNYNYRFLQTGVYTFVYVVSDLSSNSSEVSQVITVLDSKGPEMEAVGSSSLDIEIVDKNLIQNTEVYYPTSFDVGDNLNVAVNYVGLYSIDSVGNEYKVDDSSYLVSDSGTSIIYKFDKIGLYLVKFSSIDNNGNVSNFYYEITVSDKSNPVIKNISDGEIISINYGEILDVQEHIINAYGVIASDNYDSSVKIGYEIKTSVDHSYEVVLIAKDSSNNESVVVVYVDVVDKIAPVSGTLDMSATTNERFFYFNVVGGSDNSSDWWHEYRVNGGEWVRYTVDSNIEFGEGLNQNVEVCVRAKDAFNNISLNSYCKSVLVDTKVPVVSGVSNGDIVNTEVVVDVSDENLDTVQIWKDDVLLDVTLPVTFTEAGAYVVEAKDTIGNVSIVNFMINMDVYMDVVNDINASELSITSIEFDKRLLVEADIEYVDNGTSNIKVSLANIKVNADDMVYVLGVVPNTNSVFVMFSVNGANVANYADGVQLLSAGGSFKEGVNNEDCFLKFNDSYFAYVAIKESVGEQQVVVSSEEEGKNSEWMKIALIVVGSLLVVLMGYQIIKFKRRIRAA